ncbi:mobile element protein [Pseudonocardia sp. N23]|nr:mobile element protein [Pseudonocardia sp. N23]
MAEKRNPRTSATVDQLLARYLDQFDGAPNTLTKHRGYMRNHVSPLIGKAKAGALDAEVLDSFYAELRRCRQHCSGKAGAQHWTRQEHECDQRCTRPPACKPLGASVVRHIHFLLSGAFERATDLSRWDAHEIAAVAATVNSRPRKILGWKTPAEAFDEHLRSLRAGVATTD